MQRAILERRVQDLSASATPTAKWDKLEEEEYQMLVHR